MQILKEQIPNNSIDEAKLSPSVNNSLHTHENKTLLDSITSAFTTALKSSYDSAVSWISTNGTNLINHLSNTSNPHSVTAAQVGAALASHTHADKVDTTRTLTINGVAQDLSANRTWTVSGSSDTTYVLSSPVANSTVNLADVATFSHSVTAGARYKIELICSFRTAATGTGAKLAVYLPSGTGSICGYMDGVVGATALATALSVPIYAIGASNLTGSWLLTTGVSVTTADHYIGGTMFFSCATSGVLRVQWASEVAASAATLNTNSVMIVTQL